MNLGALFESLPVPVSPTKESHCFSAQPLPGYEQHRLGKDIQGLPALLILTKEVDQVQAAPIVLENLSVHYSVECLISHADGTTEKGTFAVVRCLGPDPNLAEYFLQVMTPFVPTLGNDPSHSDVTRTIDGLVELFRVMTRPRSESVQGLWAELLLIAHARDPKILIEAWHTMPEDRYDFTSADQRIEVKSSANRLRRHHFSLEQLLPPIGTKLLIASIFVERAGAGTSIKDLVEEARAKVATRPDLLMRMDRVVGLTLGNEWRVASEERFDRELAEGSIALFESSVVPRVNPELPIGVSDVQFVADLTGRPTTDISQYRLEGGLFPAAFRR